MPVNKKTGLPNISVTRQSLTFIFDNLLVLFKGPVALRPHVTVSMPLSDVSLHPNYFIYSSTVNYPNEKFLLLITLFLKIYSIYSI